MQFAGCIFEEQNTFCTTPRQTQNKVYITQGFWESSVFLSVLIFTQKFVVNQWKIESDNGLIYLFLVHFKPVSKFNFWTFKQVLLRV